MRSEGARPGRSRAHNPKVVGSNPTPATMNDEGLADVAAASPFRLPRLHPGIGSSWACMQLGAHARNGRDPAVDQEVCPDHVRRIVRREVNCQLRDFQRIGHPLAWIVGSEDVLDGLALLFAWKATEHCRVRRAWTYGVHANPAVHEFGAEDSSEMDDRGLAGRDGRGCRPPLACTNGRSDDYRRASPE